MDIRISKKDKRGKLDKALQILDTGRNLDAQKFYGAFKWNEDGVAYQKHFTK